VWIVSFPGGGGGIKCVYNLCFKSLKTTFINLPRIFKIEE
jgi:hypothetical protein